jgi:hypothetical protein
MAAFMNWVTDGVTTGTACEIAIASCAIDFTIWNVVSHEDILIVSIGSNNWVLPLPI